MKLKQIKLLVVVAILTSCSTNLSTEIKSENKKVVDLVKASPSIEPKKEEKKFSLTSEQIKQIKESSLITSNNKFGLEFFKNYVKSEENKNSFLSPLSISIAFQMLLNGAKDSTKDQISQILNLNDISLDNLNSLNKLLTYRLMNPSPDVTINVANSLWFDKNSVSLKEEFKDTLLNYYDAKTESLDFNDKNSSEIINKWVSDKTNGKIKEVVTPENVKSSIAYLINSLYFKALWKDSFDSSQNREKDFTLENGEKKKVTFLSDMRGTKFFDKSPEYQNGKFIQKNYNFDAIQIPYGKDENVSMYIFLPNNSLKSFYFDLTNEYLETLFKKFTYQEGYISFPKFKMESYVNLPKNLKNMGMSDVFDPDISDLTNLGIPLGENEKPDPQSNIYVSSAFQKCYVDVSESGTEAAAVTVIQFGASSPSSSGGTIRSFVADRPFFFVIRDNETGLNLFMGAVNDPKYE